MDQFEQARIKAQKRIERQAKYANKETPAQTEVVVPTAWIAPVAPKEKDTSFQAAVIEVKVKLPRGEFSFSLFKAAVLQNANPSKLTKGNFMNCIVTGLEPLLGRVKEI